MGTEPAAQERCRIDFDPLDARQRADPYPSYARARTEAPVLYSHARDLWVVTRYEDVKTVLTSPETFSSRGALQSARFDPPAQVRAVLAEGYPDMPLLVDTDGGLHRRIRSLVNKAFTPRLVAQLEPRIEAFATELIDAMAPQGTADLIDRFAWPFPLRTIGDLLGVPAQDLPRLHAWSHDWLLLYQDVGSVTEQVDLARSTVELQRYFADALRAREQEPGDDLMGALLRANGTSDEPLTMSELVGIPLDLLVAGHVTVTRAVGSAVKLLLEQPSGMAALPDDPDRLGVVVEELLRLESPAQGLFRTTTTETTLGGVTLPAGARVMVHFGSANRDEHTFGDPATFDPDRPDLGRHVAFGHGVHFCLGAPLARVELRIALRLIADRLPNLRLADLDEPYAYDPVVFARGFAHLHVAWDPP